MTSDTDNKFIFQGHAMTQAQIDIAMDVMLKPGRLNPTEEENEKEIRERCCTAGCPFPEGKGNIIKVGLIKDQIQKSRDSTLSSRNFPEDFKYENGNYMNLCRVCNSTFMGYKSRTLCMMCKLQLSISTDTAQE